MLFILFPLHQSAAVPNSCSHILLSANFCTQNTFRKKNTILHWVHLSLSGPGEEWEQCVFRGIKFPSLHRLLSQKVGGRPTLTQRRCAHLFCRGSHAGCDEWKEPQKQRTWWFLITIRCGNGIQSRDNRDFDLFLFLAWFANQVCSWLRGLHTATAYNYIGPLLLVGVGWWGLSWPCWIAVGQFRQTFISRVFVGAVCQHLRTIKQNERQLQLEQRIAFNTELHHCWKVIIINVQ